MTFESECLHKVRYLTRREAKKTIGRMRGRDPERRLNAYRCGHCDFWHLGRWHANARMHARERRQGAQ